jgi:hypothetical protein
MKEEDWDKMEKRRRRSDGSARKNEILKKSKHKQQSLSLFPTMY